MKGGTLPAKRRWKGLVIAVLGLVLLSLLVPLVFLLGQHNGFHSSGYSTTQQSSASDDESTHVDNLIQRLEPTFPKDFGGNIVVVEAENKTVGSNLLDGLPKERVGANRTGVVDLTKKNQSTDVDDSVNGKESTDVGDAINRKQRTDVGAMPAATENIKGTDEGEKLCELKFGSYCLWRRNHKEKVNDFTVRKMKDLLYVARAYYPSIAKLPALEKLSHEMKQNIQDFERVLSVTTVDKDLPLLCYACMQFRLNLSTTQIDQEQTV